MKTWREAMAVRASSPKTLVFFSGGLDSTAALWHVLHHPDEYGEVHAHHVHIQNEEGRWEVEAMAVNAVYEYLRTHGVANFTTSESAINTPSIGGKFLYDIEIIGFMGGYMTSRDPSIKKIVIGATGTDWGRNDEHLKETVARSKATHNAFHRGKGDHSGDIKVFPLKDMTKAEVFDSMPRELAALTWSCRRPLLVKGRYVECGVCKTCVGELREIRAAAMKGSRS